MTDKYIIYLHSLSDGVRNLSKISTITNIYPFLSCVGVETQNSADNFIKYNFVKSVVEIARVTVCGPSILRVRNHVHTASEITQDSPMPYHGNPQALLSASSDLSVAIIDTGISNHVDFTLPHRIRAFVDVIGDKSEPYDDNGHGTAVAGVLAGSGMMSGGKVRGILPDARLVIVKAIGSSGEGSTLEILQAMQWIYDNHEKFGIKVVCMSFGAPPVLQNDPLVLGAEALWQQGIVVVASSGNNGPKNGTVMSPAISPRILTVGGADTTGETPHVAEFSSRGPCNGFTKPDIVAPAVNVPCCGTEKDYITMSGTSLSTPMVAAAAALIVSKNPSYSPDRVKEIILNNAVPISCSANDCGRGLLSIESIVNYLESQELSYI